MELKLKNLKKPSDKYWKKIADYLLYSVLPGLNVFFVAMAATNAFSIKLCFYGVAGTNLLITLFKGITKFTAEPEV